MYTHPCTHMCTFTCIHTHARAHTYLHSVGMISAVVGSADQQYTQDPDGWIEVLKVEDSVLKVLFAFNDETLLKQLQFEGKLSVCTYICTR